ncbi:MAG: M23 family metallopeptidase [Spirochaetes bacterium]|nr:M23 family metallopeptidase [Spirochaetota bacterium]MBU0954826.1 M23 family metallopeptidase [Spirochaetota bacterium]
MTESQRVAQTIQEAKYNRRQALRTTRAGSKSLNLDKAAGIALRRQRLLPKVLLAAAGLFVLLLLFPPFIVPADGPVTSAFFFRFAPDKTVPQAEFHDAIDIGIPAGTRVKPTTIGRVVEAGYNNSAGYYARIKHPGGFSSYYAHLSKLQVSTGDLILLPFFSSVGLSGNTGRSTGPHLHFSIYAGNIPLPPQSLLLFHRLRLHILRF